jgi:hypothetical protein
LLSPNPKLEEFHAGEKLMSSSSHFLSTLSVRGKYDCETARSLFVVVVAAYLPISSCLAPTHSVAQFIRMTAAAFASALPLSATLGGGESDQISTGLEWSRHPFWGWFALLYYIIIWMLIIVGYSWMSVTLFPFVLSQSSADTRIM